MKTSEIAKLLNTSSQEIVKVSASQEDINNLETSGRAKQLYENCSPHMKPAVKIRWDELVEEEVQKINTAKEGHLLYLSCHRDIRPLVLHTWRKLVNDAIPLLASGMEALSLRDHCPEEMERTVDQELLGMIPLMSLAEVDLCHDRCNTQSTKGILVQRKLDIILPTIKTPHDAYVAHLNATQSIVCGIEDKWQKLIDEALLNIKTPTEAGNLLPVCPDNRRKEVKDLWNDLVRKSIPSVTTHEDASELYYNSSVELKKLVLRKWIEILTPLPTTPEEVKRLYNTSHPPEIQTMIIQALRKMEV